MTQLTDQQIRKLAIDVLLENGITVDSDQTKILDQLDSIGLVQIVVDLEDDLLDMGVSVSLVSDRAFSLEKSPFRDFLSLLTFIQEQLKCQSPS